MAATLEISRVDVVEAFSDHNFQISEVDVEQQAAYKGLLISEVDIIQGAAAPALYISAVDVTGTPSYIVISDIDLEYTVVPPPVPIDTYLLLDGEWVPTTRKQLYGGEWL